MWTVHYFSRDTIDSIIFFSDLHPEGLIESLRALPTTTTQLGLVASSTHFISGRPVTLYRDGSFFGEGAVGVALLKETKENKIVSAHVDFLGIQRLSGSLTVTR
jgi:small ligand-binding sensory domain FIST